MQKEEVKISLLGNMKEFHLCYSLLYGGGVPVKGRDSKGIIYNFTMEIFSVERIRGTIYFEGEARGKGGTASVTGTYDPGSNISYVSVGKENCSLLQIA